jgi:nucleoside permease NupC
MGFLVLRWETGHVAFGFFANQTVRFLQYVENGTSFVYGFIAVPPQNNTTFANVGPVLAFGV